MPAGGINLHHHGSRRSDTCLLRGSENRADWSVSHGAVVMVSGSLRVLALNVTGPEATHALWHVTVWPAPGGSPLLVTRILLALCCALSKILAFFHQVYFQFQ